MAQHSVLEVAVAVVARSEGLCHYRNSAAVMERSIN